MLGRRVKDRDRKDSQYGAQRKVGVADFASHCNDSVSIAAAILVQDGCEEIKLIFDGTPGLFSLCRSQLRVGDGSAVLEMCLTPFW